MLKYFYTFQFKRWSMQETRNTHEILHEESEGMRSIGRHVRITLKFICRKWNVRMWNRLIWLKLGELTGFCLYGNDLWVP
jgi:hypothetical protein